jgi:hypothetical protein
VWLCVFEPTTWDVWIMVLPYRRSDLMGQAWQLVFWGKAAAPSQCPAGDLERHRAWERFVLGMISHKSRHLGTRTKTSLYSAPLPIIIESYILKGLLTSALTKARIDRFQQWHRSPLRCARREEASK